MEGRHCRRRLEHMVGRLRRHRLEHMVERRRRRRLGLKFAVPVLQPRWWWGLRILSATASIKVQFVIAGRHYFARHRLDG